MTEVGPLTAPIMILARAAAAWDSELAEVLEKADPARLARMEHNARDLFDRRILRPGVTLDDARDVLWAYSSIESYELLVIRQGWPIERYGRFVVGGMIAALFPSDADSSA